MLTLLDLPTELLKDIFTDYGIDQHDLASLCRVSRQMKEIAERHLYAEICLNLVNDGAMKLAQTLSNGKKINFASCARSIKLSGKGNEGIVSDRLAALPSEQLLVALESVSQRCSNVHSYEITLILDQVSCAGTIFSCEQFVREMCSIKSLASYLTILHWHVSQYSSCFEALFCLPALRELHIDASSLPFFDDEAKHGHVPGSVSRGHSPIERLAIRSFTNPLDVGELLKWMPKLEDLTLCWVLDDSMTINYINELFEPLASKLKRLSVHRIRGDRKTFPVDLDLSGFSKLQQLIVPMRFLAIESKVWGSDVRRMPQPDDRYTNLVARLPSNLEHLSLCLHTKRSATGWHKTWAKALAAIVAGKKSGRLRALQTMSVVACDRGLRGLMELEDPPQAMLDLITGAEIGFRYGIAQHACDYCRVEDDAGFYSRTLS